MPPWFDGVPTVAGVLGATIVAGAVALCVARALRLHVRLLAAPARSPMEDTIERMASLADTASTEGLLIAEARVDQARDPIAALGIGLAVQGLDPRELRERLDLAVDRAAASSRAWLLGLPCTTLLTAVPAALILAFMLFNSADPSRTSGTAAFLALLTFFSLTTLVALIPPRSVDASGAAGRVISAMIQGAAVVMIRERRDGATVRRRLLGMLPAAPAQPAVRAEAA